MGLGLSILLDRNLRLWPGFESVLLVIATTFAFWVAIFAGFFAIDLLSFTPQTWGQSVGFGASAGLAGSLVIVLAVAVLSPVKLERWRLFRVVLLGGLLGIVHMLISATESIVPAEWFGIVAQVTACAVWQGGVATAIGWSVACPAAYPAVCHERRPDPS